jgi:WD40 repeat protein
MKPVNPLTATSPKGSYQVQPLLNNMFPSIHEEMRSLKQCFLEGNPVQIVTPFEGTALALTKDGSHYIFSSKQSRIAVCDANNRRLVLDKQVKEKEIWTLAVCKNDSVVLIAGTSGLIRKLSYPSLKEIDTLSGHVGEINYVLVSHDEQWVFSCGDDMTVRKWPLNETSPSSQVLYNHNGIVYGMGISNDSSLIATTGGEGVCIVYRNSGDLTETGTILSRLMPENGGNILWICRFSPDTSLLAVGSQDSNTYLYSTSDWNLLRKLSGHSERVRCMNFSHSGHILITGSIDSTIIVWDMKGNKDHIQIKLHEGWVRATIISESDLFCTSFGDDKKIIRWKIPTFDRMIALRSDDSVILRIWVSKNSGKVFALGDNYSIRVWDVSTGFQEKSFMINIPNILNYAVSGDTLNLYIFSQDKTEDDDETSNIIASLINIETERITKQITLKFFELCSSYSTPDNQYVIIGTKYTVDIYDSNFELLHNFRNHSSKVISIFATLDSRYLFTASSDGELIMSEIKSEAQVGTSRKNLSESKMVKRLLRENPDHPVQLMRVSANGELLIAVHALFFDIFSITKQSKIITITEAGIKNVTFNEDSTKALFFERNSLTVFNMDNFSMYFRQVFITPTSHITFAPNKKFWVVYRGSSSRIVPSHLNIETFDTIGKRGEESTFRKYITDIIKDKEPKHNKNFDKWIIMPNGMNTTHFYAYFNLPTYLQKALEEGAPFYPSKSGHTPLSIALELKYLSCVRAVIKGLTQSMKTNPLTLFYFDRSLTQLNDLGYSGLHRIYDYMFSRSVNRSLPKFSTDKPSQIYIENTNLIPSKTDFMPSESYSNDGYAIIFKQSYCKFPLVPGSEESLEFIRSLIECTNNKIYDTEIIKLLLEEKWKRSQWIMFIIAGVFLSFSILLAVHTVRDRNDKTFIIGPLVIECLLILYEFVQLYINKLEYFKDIWNWVDLGKTALFLAYFVMVQMDNRENNSLLAIVLFITLLRGITFFRLFTETRKYINLLYEVVFDLIPFLIIFYYSAVGFSMIFLSLGRERETDFFQYVTWGYPTDLGNYDTSNFDKAEWLTYFLVTLLISIVMLSLVVSILSDTYGRVSSHAQVADSQALAQMIYECELLFFWNRKSPESRFVFICTEQEDPTLEKVDVKEKVGKLKNLVTILAKKINNNRRMMRKVKAEFVEDSEKIISSLEI